MPHYLYHTPLLVQLYHIHGLYVYPCLPCWLPGCLLDCLTDFLLDCLPAWLPAWLADIRMAACCCCCRRVPRTACWPVTYGRPAKLWSGCGSWSRGRATNEVVMLNSHAHAPAPAHSVDWKLAPLALMMMWVGTAQLHTRSPAPMNA